MKFNDIDEDLQDPEDVPANIAKAWKKLLKDNPEGQSIVLIVGNGNGITIKSNMCPQSTFNFLTLANDVGYEPLPEASNPSRN